MTDYIPTCEEFSNAYHKFQSTMVKVFERMQEHHTMNCNMFIELMAMFAADFAATAPYDVELAVIFVQHFQLYFEKCMRIKREQLAREGANE